MAKPLMSFKQFRQSRKEDLSRARPLAEVADKAHMDDDVGSVFAMIPLDASDHDQAVEFILRQIDKVSSQAGIAVSVIPF
jgi:hypothetical protein